MSILNDLNALITNLEALRDDAEKVDSGKTGLPGTRVRKGAGDAQKALGALKKSVLETRNPA